MRKATSFLRHFLIAIYLLSADSIAQAQIPPDTFDSLNVFQFGTANGTDCWGYTAPNGHEYAIMGVTAGIVFVNVTTMQVSDTVPGTGCVWQDMATWGQYCFAVSECFTGLRVIDMQYLPDSAHLVGIFSVDGGSRMKSHNLAIDSIAGFIYLEGLGGDSSVYIHDLSNPASPVFVSSFGRTQLHDLYVMNDTAYLAEASSGEFSIWDLADKQNPIMLTGVSFSGAGFLHNIWPTNDRRFVVTTEETQDKTIKIWDIQDFQNVFIAAEVLGPNGIAHNVQVEGDFLYASHYEAGVLVYDILDPTQPQLIANFDTWPQGNNPGFGGNWGVFPHTASGKVYASNRDGRLFVLQTPANTSLPTAKGINMGSERMSRVLNHTPTFHWTFLDTVGAQIAYELEVGTDNNWTVAENWATGPVFLADSSVMYNGSTLIDGVTYFMRIKLNNGMFWGEWRQSSFTMNSIPSVPALLFPIDSFPVVPIDFKLKLTNSVDAESDQLTYDFEIYSDEALATLIESQTGLSEQSGGTLSNSIIPLAIGNQFWWRARVFDGFEFSPWSPAATFVTRNSRSFSVPVEFASISEGIIGAQYGDTLVVAPGLYVDNLLFGSKIFTIISSGGAAQTEIRPLEPLVPLVRIVSGDSLTTLSGFTMGVNSMRSAIEIEAGTDVLMRENVFRDFPVFSFMINIGNATVTLEQNLFVNNKSEFCILANGTQSNVRVINNTFDNNQGAMGSGDFSAVFMNNIVVNTLNRGVAGVFGTLDYNDFWGNKTDYGSALSAGPHDIAADPLFVSSAAGDYSLQPLSPCIDAGNPDTLFNDPDGTRGDMGAFSPGVITDVDDEIGALPTMFSLSQNYPNPFNPSTTIEFILAVRSHVTIELFNLLGQRVRLLQDRELPSGNHKFTWDGSDESGRAVPSGVYFYRMVAGDFVRTRKMVLLK